MYLMNTFFLIVGIGLILFGIAGFFIEGLTRFMNAPGGPKMKAVICAIIGLIFLLLSFLVEMPLE